MTTAEIKARKMLAARSTAQLINDWELLEKTFLDHRKTIGPEVFTARGWLLDEFERRDYDAFVAWMDDEDFEASPRKYYMVG